MVCRKAWILAVVGLLTVAVPAWADPAPTRETSETAPEQSVPEQPVLPTAPTPAAADTFDVGGMQLATTDLRETNLWATGVNPTGAVLMTPIFPGWGQLYADNSWRGALAYGVQMFYWTNMISRDRRAVRARGFAQRFDLDTVNRTRYDAAAEENWEMMRDFAWWSGGALLIIALDAYVGAHLFHFDEDPVPVPNRWDEQFDAVGGDMPGVLQPLTVTVFQWRKTF
ncbi:MAG: hypothetical protein GY838_18270 [bacterium]|nr:hypothetical protein [bacterium]